VIVDPGFLADPTGASPLVSAASWIEATLLGTIATIIAVLCVAWVGLLMFAGRIDVRRGLTVVLGCFILFGSASIVAGLRGAADSPATPVQVEAPPPLPPPPPPPANVIPYDPYAGASVIRR